MAGEGYTNWSQNSVKTTEKIGTWDEKMRREIRKKKTRWVENLFTDCHSGSQVYNSQ